MATSIFGNQDGPLIDADQNDTDKILHQRLSAMADTMGHAAFAQKVAREIVQRTRPHEAIPEVYGHYRAVIRDGIEFFLSRINAHRLLELVTAQLQMDAATTVQARLLTLAKQIPTLHKLGQIIARNPHIDPAVKYWLVQLEKGNYGTCAKTLLVEIRKHLEHTAKEHPAHPAACANIQINPEILAEASVGAVFIVTYNAPDHRDRREGVIKVLKPNVRKHLDEELAVLEETAAFFERRRSHYPLKDFRFLDVFRSVRNMLLKEVDLAAEQKHLAEAEVYFGNVGEIVIPPCLPLSTRNITAMGYLEGSKITDADLDSKQRRHLAQVLFEALVCRPLFSHRDQALFHGDPHAGNILAIMQDSAAPPKVGLLDWSLAGHLSKRNRLLTVALMQAVFRKDAEEVGSAVLSLIDHAAQTPPLSRSRLVTLVADWMQSSEINSAPLVRRAFDLLDKLIYEGFVFSEDLMLFRKAIFTLQGVLKDLHPEFDMDSVATQYMARLVAQEIPLRINRLFFPLIDRPELYPSMISNTQLYTLFLHGYMDATHSLVRTVSDSLVRISEAHFDQSQHG